MRAAVFNGQNQMAVADVPKPNPGPGEVILKVHDCGICGSDLHAVQYGFGMAAGSVMGHEFCGEVHQLGSGVKGFAIGERVTSLPFVSCGTCQNCRDGNGMRCAAIRSMGLGQLPGAYAEYVMCGASNLLKLPDNVSSREGATVEPLSVGLHGVNRSAIGAGAACVVIGAGPIGLATLLWCKAKGAGAVVVSELAPARVDLAYKLGATAVVDPQKESPAAKVAEITGREPETVFECVGVKSMLDAAIGMVAPRGQVVVLGVCMEPDQITPLQCILKEVSLDFVLGYTHAEFAETIAALSSGRIEVKPMITDVISVEDVPAMFQTLRKPTSQAKVIVEFPH